MSWQDELIPILRTLIGDTNEVQTYSDSRLEDIIVVAAHLIMQDVPFINSYSVDFTEVEIIPDPTVEPKDVAFINLTSLKAACLLLSGELKIAAGQSISVTDGPSRIDMTDVTKSKRELVKFFCDQYNQAKFDYVMGNSRVGEAILTPYTNEFFASTRFNIR